MKKRIVSAIEPKDVHPAFDVLDEEARRRGYGLTVSEKNGKYEISFSPDKDDGERPQIEVTSYFEGEVMYLAPKLTFPVVDVIESHYYDYMEYLVNGPWEEAARLATAICRWSLDPDVKWVD